MICRAIPYEGKEPYVFLSYCHKDRDLVYPLLEQMVRDGYRVWYDDGNHAGDDWLENIANHLNNCKVCVAMISEKSANSHNCRNEISFAIECKKKVLAVLLENFHMPMGMRLQLGTIHYIKKQDYPSEHMLLSKLYETSALAECKATPGSLPMRENRSDLGVKEEDSERSASVAGFLKTENSIPQKKDVISDRPSGLVLGREASEERPSDSPDPQSDIKTNDATERKKVVKAKVRVRTELTKCKEIEEIQEEIPEVPNKEPTEETEPETVFDGETQFDDAGDDESATMLESQDTPPIVIRLLSGEAFILKSALTRIGRSHRQCDIVLADNRYIGNCHAEIIYVNDRYYLRDRGSANGTYVNGRKLDAEDSQELNGNTLFRLHKEHFLFVDDESAGQIISGNRPYYLRCLTTQGIKILTEGQLLLDRSHKWEDGTLNDEKISRNNKHALLTYEDGELRLEDLGSRNGTYVNEMDIRGKGTVQLMAGNQIRLGDTVFEVGVISLQGDGK